MPISILWNMQQDKITFQIYLKLIKSDYRYACTNICMWLKSTKSEDPCTILGWCLIYSIKCIHNLKHTEYNITHKTVAVIYAYFIMNYIVDIILYRTIFTLVWMHAQNTTQVKKLF